LGADVLKRDTTEEPEPGSGSVTGPRFLLDQTLAESPRGIERPLRRGGQCEEFKDRGTRASDDEGLGMRLFVGNTATVDSRRRPSVTVRKEASVVSTKVETGMLQKAENLREERHSPLATH